MAPEAGTRSGRQFCNPLIVLLRWDRRKRTVGASYSGSATIKWCGASRASGSIPNSARAGISPTWDTEASNPANFELEFDTWNNGASTPDPEGNPDPAIAAAPIIQPR